MFTQNQIEELVEVLIQNPESRVYLGCDSVRFRKEGRWYAKFATVCVVHLNGKHGCKVFSNRSVEPDYDIKKNRPSMRLMNEVQKVCELYIQLSPFIDEFDIEIHCDISTDIKNGSNCVATQAAGYVIGVTNLSKDSVKLKPNSWAASFAADRYANKVVV